MKKCSLTLVLLFLLHLPGYAVTTVNFGTSNATPTAAYPSAGYTVSNDAWTVNDGGCCSTGMVDITGTGSTLELGHAGYDTGTAFTKVARDISQGFTASFTFQASGTGTEGFTFIVQNDPRGANAVGVNNGGMGYGNSGDASGGVSAILNSFAIGFWTGSGASNNGKVALVTSGNNPSTGTIQPSGISNFQSGPVSTVVTYDATAQTLTARFTQGATQNTVTLATGFNATTYTGNNVSIGFGTGSAGPANPVVITSLTLDTGTATPVAPAWSSAPAIGPAGVGSVVTVTATASGSPAPSYSYQWELDGNAIVGATTATYTPVIGDATHSLSCVVTATNSQGSLTGTSNAQTVAPLSAPSWSAVPVISAATVGLPVSVTGTASGNPTPTYTYQWMLDGTVINSAVNPTYTPVVAQATHSLSCVVTASNSQGSLSATSNVQTVVAASGGITAGFAAGSGSGAGQWRVNAPTCCTSTAPTITNNTLHLQQGGGYGGGSAFFNTAQSLGVGSSGFTASFDLQLQAGTDLVSSGAMTFILQNDPRGATAIGSANQGFSYGSNGYPDNGTAIAASVAFYIDFSTARFGFLENTGTSTANFNNIPSGSVTAGGYFPDIYLDLTRTQSADPIRVTINYDGAKTLVATLSDSTHPNLASVTYTLSATDLGVATSSSNGTAYVGFAGGDNGSSYLNDITQVSFTPGYTAPPAITPVSPTTFSPYCPPYSGPNKTWRIHCIGDSITNGSTTDPYNGGYRKVLNTLLTNSGVPHQFVGTRNGGDTAFLATGQAWNDGWDGTGTAYVLSHVQLTGSGWMETVKPDIILLQIGINDDLGAGIAATQDRLDQIVGTMFTWAQSNNPGFQLLIARISPYSFYSSGVVNYNNYIVNTLVPKYQALGKSITVVDQYSQFERLDRNGNPKDPYWLDPNLFGGSPHPNQAGFNRMGAAWYGAVMAATTSNQAWLQTWRANNGLPVDGSGNGALTAAPAGDGISNLIKFALGINANTPGYQGHFTNGAVSTGGSNYLSLTYTLPDPAPAGVTYIPEAGPDLGPGSFSNANTFRDSSMDTVSGGWRTITVRDTVAIGSAPRRFLRLRFTSP